MKNYIITFCLSVCIVAAMTAKTEAQVSKYIPYLGPLFDTYVFATEPSLENAADIAGSTGGAYAGTVTGAAIGSVVPVVGTAAGGFTGGVAGSFIGGWFGRKAVRTSRSWF